METPYVYKDIYEVPAPHRTFRSAKLSLAQVNEIVADAYGNMLPVSEERQTEIPDFGGARKRFAESHHIEQGFWVAGAEEKGDEVTK